MPPQDSTRKRSKNSVIKHFQSKYNKKRMKKYFEDCVRANILFLLVKFNNRIPSAFKKKILHNFELRGA